MSFKQIAIGAALLCGLSGCTDAAKISTDQVTPVTWQFNLMMDGELDGAWEYNVATADDGRIHIFGGTAWTSQSITESESLYVAREGWMPLSLDVEGDFSGTMLAADINWDGAHAMGHITVTPAEADAHVTQVDVGQDAPVYERTAFFAALRGMALTPGEEFTLTWFNVHADGLEDAAIHVGEVTEVTVPAGTFEVMPVEIVSPSVTNVVYVTTATPRDVVRVDVVGMPMVFELAGVALP